MTNEKDFDWVTPESIMFPQDGEIVQIYRDRWFLSKRVRSTVYVLTFKGKPMANPDRKIAEIVLPKMAETGADDILCLPLTYIKIDPRDY